MGIDASLNPLKKQQREQLVELSILEIEMRSWSLQQLFASHMPRDRILCEYKMKLM